MRQIFKDPFGTFNQLKDQFTQAQNAYKQLDQNDQEKYSARMQNINHSLKSAISYIDTISAGEKIEKSQIARERVIQS